MKKLSTHYHLPCSVKNGVVERIALHSKYCILTVLTVALFLAACSPQPTMTTFTPTEVSEPEQTQTSTPEVFFPPRIEEVLSRGQESVFLVCASSEDWVRPSEDEQRMTWWENLRYASDDPQTQAHVLYPWTHNFVMHYGSASLEYDLVNLTGIWTATDLEWQCDSWWRESRLGTGAELGVEIWAEIWVLGYRVESIKHLGPDYVIVVEPIDRGFQVVDFQRPAPMSLNFAFVTPEGQILDEIVEGESPWTSEVTLSD